jgi:short-subunit dehydrogenase
MTLTPIMGTKEHLMSTRRYGASPTAPEIVRDVDLHGRAVVTGASSGIGVETARALASAGAEATLAVRNTEASNTITAEISGKSLRIARRPTGPGRFEVARRIRQGWDGPLHVLVNNAGIMGAAGPHSHAAGFEI